MINIKAIIFDMDGVVTQTATLHFETWKIILDEFLASVEQEKNKPFTAEDYFYYLDGMPRKDGLARFLAARSINYFYPYTTQEECITELCDQKNKLLQHQLVKKSVAYFPDTMEFIEFLLQNGYKIALITSSKNCLSILNSAQIKHLFPIYVDGVICEDLHLSGKPEPDIFLEAAKRLNLSPDECLVVEDALAGVQAAKKGKFGGVIALDRHQKLYADFLKLDADFILPDLSTSQDFLYQQLLTNNTHTPATAALPSIESLLKHKQQFMMFLDYDGTLTPIRNRPEEAVLSPSMKTCLKHLSHHYPTVIMSGRALGNLQHMINIPSLFYSGNHGFELEGPKYSYQIGNEFKTEINEVCQQFQTCFDSIPGCLIENKIFSLSVHYRLVDEKQREIISRKMDDILAHHPQLTRHHGKKVFEVRPNILWNKGIASAYILNHFRANNPQIIPIYIGDDASDEDAFAAFHCRGITIKVSENNPETKANYYLNTPLDVQNFLNQLTGFKEI